MEKSGEEYFLVCTSGSETHKKGEWDNFWGKSRRREQTGRGGV